MLFSVDDEILKPEEVNTNVCDELKLTEYPIELLSYPLEVEEFNEINKINNDVQALEEATRIVEKEKLNDDFKDLKITEENETESIKSENDLENEEEAEKPVDVDFLIYKNNLLCDPDHVVRYCFHPKTLPMYFSMFTKFPVDDIPNCELCGSKRVFEFQVNNTLLNSIEGLCDMDWGIIAIYSCNKSCFSDDKVYVKEIVKVQKEVYETRNFKEELKENAETEEKPKATKNKKKKPKKNKKKQGNQQNEFNADSWA